MALFGGYALLPFNAKIMPRNKLKILCDQSISH
jgi:hypothetical protein